MIGKTISHYKIIEELGRGGMGVVYRAEDTKLHREVALKFLPREFTRDTAAKERFSHEAQAAAVLNHPNICTVYEIDDHEGQSFISMEYIDGRSLKSLIDEGPMGLSAALDVAMQIAAGLGEAHEKDVVHRDIKPANVIVTGKGQAKIMDFGLAKLRSQTVLTREGTTLGTVAYMSPEQAMGKTVDHRTDIWSFGVVLYEMISGQRPFKGDYDQAVLYSVMHKEPEPLTALRTGVPPELERIVNKCMEKDPGERYQTTADVVADLRHLGRIMREDMTKSRSVMEPPLPPQQMPAPAVRPSRNLRWLPWILAIALVAILAVVLIPRFFGTSEKPADEHAAAGLKMLVVLPFENLGPPEDDYFAGGITDAITARLAGLSGLGVISRQSAIQYKQSGKTTRQISEELGVDYVLEGTIQRERPSDPHSRVRIIPQLIHCADDIHLWADTYDEDMSEVFRLQSEIAERVARELDIALLEPERRALAEKPTENLEAYEYYLRGLEYADRRVNEEASIESLRMFEKAVELDPHFAVAWAQLAMARIWMYWRTGKRQHLAAGREAVDEAMRIEPDLSEGHLALGFYFYYGSRDYEKALEHFYRVQKQRPGYVDAAEAIGFIKRRQGKWEEALAIFESILKVNPRSYATNWDSFGNTYAFMRRYDEAERYIDRAMSLAPDMPNTYFAKAEIAILRDGDRESAKSYFEEMVYRTPVGELCAIIGGYDIEMSIARIIHGSWCDIVDHLCHPECTTERVYEAAIAKLVEARCSIENNESAEAAALLDSACVMLERDLKEEQLFAPNDYSVLGVAYAYLGRTEEAMRAGERAVEMRPISKDAFDGAAFVHILAEIYTVVGEYEKAIDQLEILLSVPSLMSAHVLRLDPMWDPLRENPRFRKLLE